MMNNLMEEEPHYLLDSNIVSEIIKPEPDFNVISKIAEHNSDCAICSPVWQEILYGLYHMVLVTRNTKHFAAIQEVSDLQIENWFE